MKMNRIDLMLNPKIALSQVPVAKHREWKRKKLHHLQNQIRLFAFK